MSLFASSKKVVIFGKEYSEKEWKKAVISNKGVFKRLPEIPKQILGPTLTDNLDIVGDMGVMESMSTSGCDDNQRKVIKTLYKQDQGKALEYIFTITNADIVWKKKINFLHDFLEHVRLEEERILEEESIVEKAEKMRNSLDDSILEEHFSDDFQTLKRDIQDLDKFKHDLEMVASHLQNVEKKIKNHLAGIKSRFPFLFK